jgi:hypothetical protein
MREDHHGDLGERSLGRLGQAGHLGVKPGGALLRRRVGRSEVSVLVQDVKSLQGDIVQEGDRLAHAAAVDRHGALRRRTRSLDDDPSARSERDRRRSRVLADRDVEEPDLLLLAVVARVDLGVLVGALLALAQVEEAARALGARKRRSIVAGEVLLALGATTDGRGLQDELVDRRLETRALDRRDGTV